MEFINKTDVDRVKLNPYVVPIAVGENTLLINPLHGTADLVSNDEAEYAQCCTPGIWPELDEVLLTRGYWIWGGSGNSSIATSLGKGLMYSSNAALFSADNVRLQL